MNGGPTYSGAPHEDVGRGFLSLPTNTSVPRLCIVGGTYIAGCLRTCCGGSPCLPSVPSRVVTASRAARDFCWSCQAWHETKEPVVPGALQESGLMSRQPNSGLALHALNLLAAIHWTTGRGHATSEAR
jgi:hypothetical protein